MTYALQWAEDIAYLYTLEVGDSTSLGDWGHSEYLLLRWAYSHSGRRSAISLLLGRTASLIPGHQMLGFQGSYRLHMYQLYNREWIHTHECISTCLGRVYIVFFFKISTTKTSATIYCCCFGFFAVGTHRYSQHQHNMCNLHLNDTRCSSFDKNACDFWIIINAFSKCSNFIAEYLFSCWL